MKDPHDIRKERLEDRQIAAAEEVHKMEHIIQEVQAKGDFRRVVRIATGEEFTYEGFAPLDTSVPIRDVANAIANHVVDGDVLPGVALVYDEDVFQLWKVLDKQGVISLRTYFKQHHPNIKQFIMCYPESTHTW